MTFIRDHTTGTSASGTSVTATLAADVPAGNLLAVWAAMDNTGTTTPTVSSIDKPGGETATWTRVASHDASSATSAAAVRGELWVIKTTAAWPSGTVITATLSASPPKSHLLCQEHNGVLATLRGTSGTGTSTAGTPSAATSGTALQAGDLVIGAATGETSATPSGDTDTTNGSWSTALTGNTGGGASAAQVSSILQHKYVTAAGVQTYDPVSVGTVDSGAAVASLQFDPNKTLTDTGVSAGSLSVAAAVTLTDQGAAADSLGVTEPGAGGQVTRGSTQGTDWTLNESASTTSLACTLPSAMATGKLLVAHVVSGGIAPTLPDASWAWASGSPFGSSVEVGIGLASTTDPAAALTFGQPALGRMTVVLVVYSGADLTTPMDVTPTTDNQLATTVTPASVTTTLDGAMLISGEGIDSSTTAITTPSGMTLVARSTNTPTSIGKGGAFADEARPTAGATGSRTWTVVATGLRHIAYLGAVRPAPGGGGPTAKTLTDSGQAADVFQVSAAVPVVDSAAAADSLQVAVAISLLDSAAAADTLQVAVPKTLTDSATAAETAQTAAAVPLVDAGAGSDQATASAAVPLPDQATAADSLTVDQGTTPKTLGDSGVGVDLLRPAAALPLADTAAATDQLTVAVAALLADSAAGSDSLTVGTGGGQVTRGSTQGTDWTLNETTSGTSLACTLPTAMAAGKLLVAHVIGAPATVATGLGLPATGGWAWASGTPVGGSALVAVGLAFTTNPAAGLTFTQDTTTRMTVVLVVYSGADVATPMDVALTTGSVTGTSLALTGVSPSAGAMLLSGEGANASTTTITAPPEMTLVARNTSGVGKGGAFADEARPTAGTTGTRTWTIGTTATFQVAYLGAVRAAVGGGPTQVTLTDTAVGSDSLQVDGPSKLLADSGTATDSLQVQVPTATVEIGAIRWVTAAGPTAKTLNDSGAAADSLRPAAQTPLADAAAAAETLRPAATVSLPDSAAGAELLQPTAQATLGDQGTATDQLSVVQGIPLALTDSGTAADQAQVAATVSLADNGTAAETIQPAAQTVLVDTGTATDSVSTQQGAVTTLTDSATAADQPTVSAAVPLADSGLGSDQAQVGVAALLTQTGTSTDTLQTTQAGAPNLFDQGSAADTATVAAAVPVPDSAAATDSLVLAQTRTLADTATASEQLQVGQFVPITLTDTAQATDQLLPVAQTPLADTAAAADQLTTNQAATPILADSGTGAEQLLVTQAKLLTDSGTGIDQLTVNVGRVLTDQATATETLRPTALAVLSDTATTDDVLALSALSALRDSGTATDAMVVLTVAYWIRTTSQEPAMTTESREPALATSSQEKGTL